MKGFTVVEVLVSLVLLSLGVLAFAASSSVAARLLRQAALEEGAADHASSVLDSLIQLDDVVPGEHRDGPYHARWSITPAQGATRLELWIEFSDGRNHRVHTFATLHRPLPPPLSP